MPDNPVKPFDWEGENFFLRNSGIELRTNAVRRVSRKTGIGSAAVSFSPEVVVIGSDRG